MDLATSLPYEPPVTSDVKNLENEEASVYSKTQQNVRGRVSGRRSRGRGPHRGFTGRGPHGYGPPRGPPSNGPPQPNIPYGWGWQGPPRW